MFFDLLVAGVAQGYLWKNLAPWEQSLVMSMPFWHLRTIAGTVIVSAVMLFAYNMWMTARHRGAAAPEGSVTGDGLDEAPGQQAVPNAAAPALSQTAPALSQP
jgi:cytochrome c oxidase cbb3-type subunit 1